MHKKRKKSIFIPCVLFYTGIVAVALYLSGDSYSEGILKLILLGFVPIVIVSWIRDALVRGEIWRQGPRSLTGASTMNEQRVCRKEQPVLYWLAISAATALAIALTVFVVMGMLILLKGVE